MKLVEILSVKNMMKADDVSRYSLVNQEHKRLI